MMEFFTNTQWQNFTPFVLFYLAVVAPLNDKFKNLKGHFPQGDKALWRALLIKTAVPIVALGVGLFGFFLATQSSNLAGSWIAAITGIVVSACLLSLTYVGPFYPLFDELADAETRADRFADSNSSQGT